MVKNAVFLMNISKNEMIRFNKIIFFFFITILFYSANLVDNKSIYDKSSSFISNLNYLDILDNQSRRNIGVSNIKERRKTKENYFILLFDKYINDNSDNYLLPKDDIEESMKRDIHLNSFLSILKENIPELNDSLLFDKYVFNNDDKTTEGESNSLNYNGLIKENNRDKYKLDSFAYNYLTLRLSDNSRIICKKKDISNFNSNYINGKEMDKIIIFNDNRNASKHSHSSFSDIYKTYFMHYILSNIKHKSNKLEDHYNPDNNGNKRYCYYAEKIILENSQLYQILDNINETNRNLNNSTDYSYMICLFSDLIQTNIILKQDYYLIKDNNNNSQDINRYQDNSFLYQFYFDNNLTNNYFSSKDVHKMNSCAIKFSFVSYTNEQISKDITIASKLLLNKEFLLNSNELMIIQYDSNNPKFRDLDYQALKEKEVIIEFYFNLVKVNDFLERQYEVVSIKMKVVDIIHNRNEYNDYLGSVGNNYDDFYEDNNFNYLIIQGNLINKLQHTIEKFNVKNFRANTACCKIKENGMLSLSIIICEEINFDNVNITDLKQLKNVIKMNRNHNKNVILDNTNYRITVNSKQYDKQANKSKNESISIINSSIYSLNRYISIISYSDSYSPNHIENDNKNNINNTSQNDFKYEQKKKKNLFLLVCKHCDFNKEKNPNRISNNGNISNTEIRKYDLLYIKVEKNTYSVYIVKKILNSKFLILSSNTRELDNNNDKNNKKNKNNIENIYINDTLVIKYHSFSVENQSIHYIDTIQNYLSSYNNSNNSKINSGYRIEIKELIFQNILSSDIMKNRIFTELINNLTVQQRVEILKIKHLIDSFNILQNKESLELLFNQLNKITKEVNSDDLEESKNSTSYYISLLNNFILVIVSKMDNTTQFPNMYININDKSNIISTRNMNSFGEEENKNNENIQYSRNSEYRAYSKESIDKGIKEVLFNSQTILNMKLSFDLEKNNSYSISNHYFIDIFLDCNSIYTKYNIILSDIVNIKNKDEVWIELNKLKEHIVNNIFNNYCYRLLKTLAEYSLIQNTSKKSSKLDYNDYLHNLTNVGCIEIYVDSVLPENRGSSFINENTYKYSEQSSKNLIIINLKIIDLLTNTEDDIERKKGYKRIYKISKPMDSFNTNIISNKDSILFYLDLMININDDFEIVISKKTNKYVNKEYYDIDINNILIKETLGIISNQKYHQESQYNYSNNSKKNEASMFKLTLNYNANSIESNDNDDSNDRGNLDIRLSNYLSKNTKIIKSKLSLDYIITSYFNSLIKEEGKTRKTNNSKYTNTTTNTNTSLIRIKKDIYDSYLAFSEIHQSGDICQEIKKNRKVVSYYYCIHNKIDNIRSEEKVEFPSNIYYFDIEFRNLMHVSILK